MCNKRSTATVRIGKKKVRVDACLKDLIYALNVHGIETLACDCGHRKYPMTIVYRADNDCVYEFCSGIEIHRKKRFYVRDKQGMFFIPETIRKR